MLLLFLCLCILFLFVMVISCCAMAGSDPFYQQISDIEQIAFIKKWNEEKRDRLKWGNQTF